MYKLLSNTLLSSLAQYAEEIVGDHRCEFLRNWSATHQIFCLRKKWEFIEAVHHLFVDLRKAYDSVRRKVLYNRMCLNEPIAESGSKNFVVHTVWLT